MTDKPYTDADVQQAADAILNRLAGGGSYLDAARAVLAELAAAGRLIPPDDSPWHVIEFRPDGWTIKHPLSCRIGDLFGCRVNLAAEDLDGPPAPPGRYAVTVDGIDGRLRIGERVDQEPTPPEDDPADADADQAAVQNLLDDATRAFADAGTSSERVEAIRDLLAGWYAAWPASAVTDEHEGIAHQLVALVYAAEARASSLRPVTMPGGDRLWVHRSGTARWLPDTPMRKGWRLCHAEEQPAAVASLHNADIWGPEPPCFHCGQREADHVDGRCPKYRPTEREG